MATPAYTNFDRAKPSGAVNPTPYSGDALLNDRANADSIVTGRADGWTITRTQGAGPDSARPQFIIWSKGLERHRLTFTWTGFNPTAVAYDWSNDSGATWSAEGANQVNTFDGDQNITGTTNSGGVGTWLMEVWAKCLKVIADLGAHAAATGTSVHGNGTMAGQNDSAVDINGGNIDGATWGGAVRGPINATRSTESTTNHVPGSGAGVAINWGLHGSHNVTNNGVNALTFSGVPAGFAGVVVHLTNFNSTTFPFADAAFGVGGKPSIAGAASVWIFTIDGGASYRAGVMWQAV